MNDFWTEERLREGTGETMRANGWDRPRIPDEEINLDVVDFNPVLSEQAMKELVAKFVADLRKREAEAREACIVIAIDQMQHTDAYMDLRASAPRPFLDAAMRELATAAVDATMSGLTIAQEMDQFGHGRYFHFQKRMQEPQQQAPEPDPGAPAHPLGLPAWMARRHA